MPYEQPTTPLQTPTFSSATAPSQQVANNPHAARPINSRQASQSYDAAVDDSNTGVTDALRPAIPSWVGPADPSSTHYGTIASPDDNDMPGHSGPRPSAGPRRLSKSQSGAPSKLPDNDTPGLDKHGMPIYTRRPNTTPVLKPEYRYCARDEHIKPYRTHHCRVCGTVSSNLFVYGIPIVLMRGSLVCAQVRSSLSVDWSVCWSQKSSVLHPVPVMGIRVLHLDICDLVGLQCTLPWCSERQ
jgi:hypothetical protein